jgi:hypothetical protein
MKTPALVIALIAVALRNTAAADEPIVTPITGHVVDAAGNGVARVSLQAIHDNEKHTGRAHALTGADGSFRLLATGTEPVNIITAAAGRYAFKATVPPGTQDLVLRVANGGRLQVKVQTAEGLPVPDLSVQGPTRIDGAHYLEFFGTRTGPDGVASLAVPAGEIQVVVRNGQGRTLAIATGTVVADQQTSVAVTVAERTQ